MWPGQEKPKQPKITVTQKTSCSDSAISGLSGWTKIKPLGPAASVTDQYRYKPKNSEMERDRAPSIMSGSSSSRGKAFSLMSGGSSHSTSSVSKMLANAKSDIKESAYEGCGGPLGPARTKEERRNRKLLIAGVCSSALLIILCLALKEIGYNNSLKEIMDEVEKDEVEISEDVKPFIPNQNMYPGMINPYFINPYLFQQPVPNQPINQHTLTVSSNQQPSAQALIAPEETEDDALLELLDSDLSDSTLYSRVIKKFQALQTFISSLMSLNIANPEHNERLHNMNSKLGNLVDRETKLLLDEATNKLDDLEESIDPTDQSIIKQKLMRPANTAWSEDLEKKMEERRKMAMEKREERLRLAEERRAENQHKRREKFSMRNLD